MTGLVSEASGFLADAGYLRTNLLTSYRYTWRSPTGDLRNELADLVAFSEPPHTMKTACVGVLELPSDDAVHDALRRLAFLSTPVAIVGTPKAVTLWALRREQHAEKVVGASR